jgi:hypothetical protein
MKKLLLIFSLACANLLIAQPTLTLNSTQYLPGVYTFQTNNTQVAIPVAGANVSWDYSNIMTQGQFVTTIESYDNSEYPDADLRASGGQGVVYFMQNLSGIYTVGMEVNTGGMIVSFNYSDYELRQPLPFTYQSTFSDEFACTFMSGVQFDRVGNTTFTGYGYGTLELPSTTLTDVLCVKMTQSQTDDSGMGFVVNSSRESYTFYKNGFNTPVFNIDVLDSGSLTYTNSWLESQVLEVIESSSVTETFMMYPNPAGSVLNLKVFDNQSTVNIFDVNGRIVYTAQGNLLTETIDLSTFESGVYFVNVISSTGATSTEKLVVNKY